MHLVVSEAARNMAQAILRNAEDQKERILLEAKKRAEEIMREAEKSAGERKAKLIEQGKEDLDRFKEQEIIKIKIEFKRKLYEHAWSLIDSVISNVASSLEKIREQKEVYGSFMSTLLANSIKLIAEDEVIIHIDKRDESMVRELIEKLPDSKRIRVMPDLSTAGGFTVTSKDNFKEVDETIENRLGLKSRALREKLYDFIFGDLNVEDW
ncbi:MAG: V-type ATP synthase subunit E [Thermoproteota archaeon]